MVATSGIEETLPDVAQMHSGLVQTLSERLRLEPTVLAARIGMGAEEVASAAVADHIGVMLDAVAVGSQAADLALAITRTVVAEHFAGLAPNILGLVATPSEEAVGQLAEIYGRRVGVAIDIASGRTQIEEEDWTIADALGVSRLRRPLAITSAHRLNASVLWELRDLASSGLSLLLVTTPEHKEKLSGKNGPLYGYGAYVEMPVLGLPVWTRKLSPKFDALTVTELFRQAVGRTAVMLEVFANHHGADRDLGSAWFRTVDEHDNEAHTVMSLAPQINELAPSVLMAVAHGEAPYGRDDRPDRVARILRHLRELDLTEQREPRKWQIADPLLAGAIRRLRPGYLETFPRV